MSDTSSNPPRDDRPATTIWDHYSLTRRMVAYFCATFAGYGLLILVALAIVWSLVDGWDLSQIGQKSRVIVLLLFVIVEGALGFCLYRGHFGLGRTAIAVAAIAAFLWLVTAVWMAYTDRSFLVADFPFPDGVYLLWAMSLFPFLLIGGMIFFVTYLLCRISHTQ